MNASQFPMILSDGKEIGTQRMEIAECLLPGAKLHIAEVEGDGLSYSFPAGTLAEARYLTADFLLEGSHLAVFAVQLQEGAEGPTFGMGFGLLGDCSARMRIPLEAVNQKRWRYPREGAWLKPMCWGERVDLARVDRMRLVVTRKSDRPVRWWMTPMTATIEEPPHLEQLTLPKGNLLDALGQSRLHEWPGKTRSPGQLIERLHGQLQSAPSQSFPAHWNRWGGWQDRRFEATGFFRTHHDGERWWMVDPDGFAFWSTGPDCVRASIDAAYSGLDDALDWVPDNNGPYATIFKDTQEVQIIDYLQANLIRAFGPEEWYGKWQELILGELHRVGFNTIANWSDWHTASRAGFPYTRPLDGRTLSMGMVYRDFPDVFAPEFETAASKFAGQLLETVGDPAMIGYFLMNEPTWGFAEETPAAGMLFTTPSCASRRALSEFIQARYADEESMQAAWACDVTIASLADGEWKLPLNQRAQDDLADFSEVMVTRFFRLLSEACRAVDPQHLNLGVRYYTVPPAWAVEGMSTFDVFSMNCYKRRVPTEQVKQISQLLNMPVLIGEWHFGALDAGLPGSGIGHVPDQASRGQAYRVYVEDAAAQPWCVGVHYFTLYDQSAIGRFDGENYNIGFIDICHRPYEELVQAARATHERLYEVAEGHAEPYADEPEYLPLLFL